MKNSPREILLRRHREADASLDRMCQSLLARELAPAPPPSPSVPTALTRMIAGFAVKAWTELFWSCRLAWTGLAAVWMLALVINSLSLENAPREARQTRAAAPAGASYVLMQRYLLSELREPAPTRPPAPSHIAPQSRREDLAPNSESALALDHHEYAPTTIRAA